MSMNKTEQGPWVRDSYTEVAFDGRDGEFLTRIPCARHVETDERLVLSEIIPRLNALEREVANGKSEGDGHSQNGRLPNGHFDTAQHGRAQQIRQALYAAGIDWNATTAKLAACDWVTEAYIHAHVTAADPDFLGLAIKRMLDGLPPPIPVRERKQQAALKRYPHIRR
jgi:hypothetical protein